MNNKFINKIISIALGTIILSTFAPVVSAQSNAPSLFTNSSSDISTTSATLHGSVNPNDSSTTAWFEYGPTQWLGLTTSTFAIGGGNSQTSYSASVFNLSSNTTYYYRAAARNSYGTSYGPTLSFITQSPQTIVTTTNTTTDLSGISNSLTQLSAALVSLNTLVGNLDNNRVTERIIEKRVEVASSDIKVGGVGFFASLLALIPGGGWVTILLIAFLVLLIAIAIRKLLG